MQKYLHVITHLLVTALTIILARLSGLFGTIHCWVESFNQHFCFTWNVLLLDRKSVLLFPVLTENKQDGKAHFQKQQKVALAAPTTWILWAEAAQHLLSSNPLLLLTLNAMKHVWKDIFGGVVVEINPQTATTWSFRLHNHVPEWSTVYAVIRRMTLTLSLSLSVVVCGGCAVVQLHNWNNHSCEEQFDVWAVGSCCFLSATQWSKSARFIDFVNPK